MEAITVQIAKLELQAGDTIAVMVPNLITVKQAEHIKKSIGAYIPEGVKCLVLSGGMTLQRVRMDQATALAGDTSPVAESIVRTY